MFNVLRSAEGALTILNKPLEIKVTVLPQTQQWHNEAPARDAGQQYFMIRGTVQTDPSGQEVVVNTINSPRLFRIYISSPVDILSIMQAIPREMIVEFTYLNARTQARVDSFSDYRYNGWVCLKVSECVPPEWQQYNLLNNRVSFT